jgi:hypothetical protein
MDNVQGFDSVEQMFDAMGKAEASANESLTPGQIRLRDAVHVTGYWVRAIPEMDGVVIYGKALTVGNLRDEGAGFDVEDNRRRGYLTGKAFSSWEPQGEYGDTHVSQVVPISLHTFTLAEAFGWPTLTGLREEDHRILGKALAEHEYAARV